MYLKIPENFLHLILLDGFWVVVIPIVRMVKFKFLTKLRVNRGCGVMAKALDCGIVVREFVLKSRYNVHFRANTLGKGMNPLILPAMGKIVPLLFISENGFGIKNPKKSLYAIKQRNQTNQNRSPSPPDRVSSYTSFYANLLHLL